MLAAREQAARRAEEREKERAAERARAREERAAGRPSSAGPQLEPYVPQVSRGSPSPSVTEVWVEKRGRVSGVLSASYLPLLAQEDPCLLYTSDAADDTPC
eukprot:5576490-Pyramimonas_sp.AAC.1